MNMSKRKMYNTNNLVRFYEIMKDGYVEVMIVGMIPYPGFWCFTISPKDYDYGKDGYEEKLKELLEVALDREDWTLKGYSVSCGFEDLLKEIKKEQDDLLKEELLAIEEFIVDNNK